MCGNGEHTEFWRGNVRGRDHLEDLNVDVRIMLKWIFKHDYGVMNWIAEDRKKLRAFVKSLMNIPSINAGHFLTIQETIGF
jgi:hypothetical protein